MNVTPLTIEMMLVCYYSPEPVDELGRDRWHSTAGQRSLGWLQEQGLISVENNRATARGEAWVKFICETPLPEQKWVRPALVETI